MSRQTAGRGVAPAPVNALSPEFLASRGVSLTPPLKAWLTRAGFIARTRSSVTERQRYERWALHVVEDALAMPGGAASFPWAKTSPVMPLDAPDRTPSLLSTRTLSTQSASQEASTAASTVRSAAVASPSLDVATVPPQHATARDVLLQECIQRAPLELRPFVTQAFAEKDVSIPSNSSADAVYGATSFLDVIRRATDLHQLEEHKQRVSQTPSQISGSPLPTPRPRPAKRAREDGAEQPRVVGDTNAFFAFLLLNESSPEAAEPGERVPIVGTSVSMERLYSRYEPVAEDIRVPAVLAQAFQHVQNQAASKEVREGRAVALQYLSDQLKGMRQDLRVQNVMSNFAVSVYELHAAVALERGDIGEFNQCQSALKSLYDHPLVDMKMCAVADFFYYRLIYLCLSRQYDALSTELITYTNATHRPKGDRGVADFVSRKRIRSCLQLCAACEDGDVASMCRGLATFNASMTHLVRIYLPRLRVTWLEELLRAMKGPVSVRFLMVHLGFVGLPSGRCSKHEKHNSRIIWLDGSKEEAERGLAELLTRLKIELPTGFSFASDVTAALELVGGEDCSGSHSVFLDASTAYTAIQSYLSYLTARKDVSLGK